MKLNSVLILLFLVGNFSHSFAGERFLLKREVTLNSGESLNLAYLNMTMNDTLSERVLAKRPGRSFMSSAVLPGAGQFYNGSVKMAIGFFVAEIGRWWGYSTLQGKANDKEEEYKAFADEFWIYDDWILSGDTEGGHTINENPITGEPVKSDEYYENIGKYDQFNRGWTGAISRDDLTAERETYIQMQDDANNLFSWATTIASTVMINHIFSAAEAVYTAKKLNDKASMAISLKVVPVLGKNRISKRISLSVAW